MQPTSFWWYIWQTQVSLQQLLISTTTTIIAKRMLGLSHLYKVHWGSRDFFLQHFNIVLLGDELPAMFLAVSLRLHLQHATNVWMDKMKPTVRCSCGTATQRHIMPITYRLVRTGHAPRLAVQPSQAIFYSIQAP